MYSKLTEEKLFAHERFFEGVRVRSVTLRDREWLVSSDIGKVISTHSGLAHPPAALNYFIEKLPHLTFGKVKVSFTNASGKSQINWLNIFEVSQLGKLLRLAHVSGMDDFIAWATAKGLFTAENCMSNAGNDNRDNNASPSAPYLPQSVPSNDELRFSSRMIAEKTNKRHRDVTRDIRVICEKLGLDTRRFAHIYQDTMNRQQEEYFLPERYLMNVLMGYSVELRDAVIMEVYRLKEENKRLKAPTDYISALEALLSSEREKQGILAQVEQLKSENEAMVYELTHLSVKAYMDKYARVIPARGTAPGRSLAHWAVKYCKDHDLNISKVAKQIPIDGEVRETFENEYPIEALHACWPKVAAKYHFNDNTPKLPKPEAA